MRPAVPPTELPLPRAWGLGRGTPLLPQPGSGSGVGSLHGPDSGAPLVGRQPPPRPVLTPAEPRVFIHLPGCPTASGFL